MTFTNLASGNSSFNSISLTAIASSGSSLIISDASTSSGKKGTLSATGTSAIQITGLSPTQVGNTLTVTLTVTGSAGCGGSVTWTAQAWTGSPGVPSNFFTLQPTPGNRTTSITAQACSLSITAPSSAATGIPFAVTVGLTGGPGGANVTLSSTDCTLTGGDTIAATGYSALFPAVTITSLGTCTLNVTADQGYGQTALSGFKVFGGVLGCNNGNNLANSDGILDPNVDAAFIGDPGWGLRRGPNLDDTTGANCVLVDFTFALVGNEATLVYDKAAGPPTQLAQFMYVIQWPAIDPAATSGWPTNRPELTWVTTADGPQYVPGLACLSDDLSLGSAVMPTIPDVPPFADNPNVQYQPGQPAKMCIAQQGWTSIGEGLIQQWTKVIDQADGGIRMP